MKNKEIWPCRYSGNCIFCCDDGNPDVCGRECYLTTHSDLKAPGNYRCEVPDSKTIRISYPTYGAEKPMLHEVVNLISQEDTVTFHQIHYICTHQPPGPAPSIWPLIWNGLVEIDDEWLTFEFIERRDSVD